MAMNTKIRKQLHHRLLLTMIVVSAAVFAQTNASADSEITLFNGSGKPEAYIAPQDELAIYLWDGKPVAYLKKDSESGFHVYGFNGKHLGWFVDGVIWDHTGNAACALKERLQRTEFEPFKAFKQFQPFKSFEEFAPFRPLFSNSWSVSPCQIFLLEGAK